jgi:hypothetical protein
LHRRYLGQLGRQEGEVEKYWAEVKRLQEQEHAQKKALNAFLAAFSAELSRRLPAPAPGPRRRRGTAA